jgi:hypothetical protein
LDGVVEHRTVVPNERPGLAVIDELLQLHRRERTDAMKDVLSDIG